MNEQIKHAFDEYNKAVQAEKAHSEEIKSREGGKPTAEDTQTMERIEADIKLWKDETERLVKVAGRSKEVDEVRASFASLFEQSDKTERVTTKRDIDVLAGMFTQARGGQMAIADEEDPNNPFKIDPNYLQRLANRFNTRALASTGGTAFGDTFIERVLFYEVDESPMLDPAVVQVIVTPRGEAMEFPRHTAGPNYAGTLTAEAGLLTLADPTISKVTLNAYKYGGITLWSAELDEDNVINLRDILAQSAAREIAEEVNAPLTTGDGSNKPKGIVSAAANGGTAGTAGTFFSADDLITLHYGRKAAYRRRGNWMVATTALSKIRKLEDTSGQKIWERSLVPGQPETILGRPVFENPDMAAVGSASKSVLFGDTQAYITRRVGAARVELSRDFKFQSDQLALKVVERIDGDLLDDNAVAYLVSANS